MPQPSLNTVFLCTIVSSLRRLRARFSATRATRWLPTRVMTRTEMVMSSVGRNSPDPATTLRSGWKPSLFSRTMIRSTSSRRHPMSG